MAIDFDMVTSAKPTGTSGKNRTYVESTTLWSPDLDMYGETVLRMLPRCYAAIYTGLKPTN